MQNLNQQFNNLNGLEVDRKTLEIMQKRADKEGNLIISSRVAKILHEYNDDRFLVEIINLVEPFGLNGGDDETNIAWFPKYSQFKNKPKEAIKHLLKTQKGDCLQSLFRKDIGFIDIVWGENDQNNKGFGLKHIVEKHGKEIEQLGFKIEDFIPIIVQFGDFKTLKDENKIELSGQMFRIIISKKAYLDGKKFDKTFVLSAFDLRPMWQKEKSVGLNGTYDGISFANKPLLYSTQISNQSNNNNANLPNKNGLNAQRHQGLEKTGLDDCGRLQPGYKYVAGGQIVKSAEKTPRKCDTTCAEPTKKPSATTKVSTKKTALKQKFAAAAQKRVDAKIVVRQNPSVNKTTLVKQQTAVKRIRDKKKVEPKVAKVVEKQFAETPFDAKIDAVKKELKTETNGKKREVLAKRGNKLIAQMKRFDADAIETNAIPPNPFQRKTTKSNSAVIDLPLSQIFTDEKRFQNRNELDQRIVANIVKNFDSTQFDPIIVWFDAKQKKYFVLAGHHRFEALKLLGKTDAPVKIATYTETEAIDFAKVKSNANRTLELPQERAKIYRELLKNGTSKTKVIDQAKEQEGKNASYIVNLSALNSSGLTLQALNALANTPDKQNATIIEKIADWIGAARLQNPELTNAHEKEMFDFLQDKDSSDRIKTKADFLQKITAITGMFFDFETALNLKRFKYQTEGEKLYDEEFATLKKLIADKTANRESLRERINNPAHPEYISPKSADYNQVIKALDNMVDKYAVELKQLQTKLNELGRNKGYYTNQGSNQVGLFGAKTKAIKLSSYTIATNCTDLTDAKDGFNEVWKAEKAYKKIGKTIPKFWKIRAGKLVDKIKVFEAKEKIVETGLFDNLKISTDDFKKMKVSELREFTLKFYNENLKGKKIAINKILKSVELVGKVAKKIKYPMYSEKAAIIKDLEQIITNSSYNNFGERKKTDSIDVLGFLNFNSKIYIDGIKKNVRISIILRNNRQTQLKSFEISTKPKKSDTTNKASKNKTLSDIVTSLSESKSSKNNTTNQNNGLNFSKTRTSLAHKLANRSKATSFFDVASADFSKFLGKIERKNRESVVITITGGEGSGKTRFGFQFMNALAQHHTVGHASMEEHVESQLYIDKAEQYLNPKALQNINVEEIKTMQDLDTLVRNNEVIVIDSFQKMRELNRGFEVDKDLRKKYDGKLFLIIFQQTTDGKMRGGSTSQFDADIVLFTEAFDDYRENYVYATKNRYQKQALNTLHLNVFTGKLDQTETEFEPDPAQTTNRLSFVAY